MMGKFWIVWDMEDEVVLDAEHEEGPGFRTKELAQKAAKRNAIATGTAYAVLECIGIVEPLNPIVQVAWREL